MPRQWLYPIASVGFKLNLRLFAKFEVVGRENVPQHGPVIVVCNHLSNIDPAIVASALPMRPGFLAKKELFKNPIVRFLLHGYGAHPVDRGRADLTALNWAAARLKKGGALIVFPEGTRSRGQGLLPAQQGPVLLAKMTGAPILPMALTGSEPLQNLAKVFYPRATMRMVIGKPYTVIAPPGVAGREVLVQATRETMARIAAMLPENYRGHYAADAGMKYIATAEVQDSGRGAG